MARARDSFSDLLTRLLTGAAVAIVGLAAIWAGYPWFTLLVAVIIGVLIWELAQMLGAPRNAALGLGVAGGVLLLAAKLLPIGVGLPLLAVTGLAGLSLLPRNRTLFFVVATLIMLASFGLITHRDTFGVTWMLWLVLVVAVTDIAGYFAGRLIGGPKFWPRVLGQLRDISAARQRHDIVAARIARDQVERVLPDGPGGPENADPTHVSSSGRDRLRS